MWSCRRCTLDNDPMANECEACGAERPTADTSDDAKSTPAGDPASWVPVGLPRCHYGTNCKRQNPQHFKEESHPPSHKKVLEYKIVIPKPPDEISPKTEITDKAPDSGADESTSDATSSSVPSTSAHAAAPASSVPAPSSATPTKAKYDIRSFFTPSSSPSKTDPAGSAASRKLPVSAKSDDDTEDAPRKKQKVDAPVRPSSPPLTALARSTASARAPSPADLPSPAKTPSSVPSPAAVAPPGGLIYIGRKATAASGGSGGSSDGWAQTKKGFLDMLAALERSEKDKGDRMRAKAYGQAMNAFRDHSGELRSGAEAMKLKGVGKKIAAKFDEFLASGSVGRVDRDRADPRSAALAALTSVTGVGPVLAKELLDGAQKIDSVEALRRAVEGGRVAVSNAVKVGLKHHEELVQRIPRAEVEVLRGAVTAAARAIDGKIEVEVLGSYRRGASTSGDIDCLVTHPQYTKQPGAARFNFVTQLVAALRRDGFLVADIVNGEVKYMGVCRVPGQPDALARRIDIMSIVQEEWACAVTYFTGSGAFNRKMRLHALERGFTLNEHALCHFDNATKTKGAAVSVPDERALFTLLGLAWVPPAERELGK